MSEALTAYLIGAVLETMDMESKEEALQEARQRVIDAMKPVVSYCRIHGPSCWECK